MPDLTKLSAAKLEAQYDKRLAASSAAVRALINAGYGLERAWDTRKRAEATSDALAVEWCRAFDAFSEVAEEKQARMHYNG